MLRREDASARLSVLGCAQGTSVHICAKYRHKQSRKVVKQISGKLQRSPKYHFHPSIFFLFTLMFFCLVKYEHKGRSERECRGSKWVVKWSFASSGPATWEENTFIQKTNCSLLKAWMLFFFLEEARCYLSCANKIIHYESCFSLGAQQHHYAVKMNRVCLVLNMCLLHSYEAALHLSLVLSVRWSVSM